MKISSGDDCKKLACTNLWCDITNTLIEKYKFATESGENLDEVFTELRELQHFLTKYGFLTIKYHDVKLSNKVFVADPCYKKTMTDCTATIENVLEGKYIPVVTHDNKNTISNISLVHESYLSRKGINYTKCVESENIGVDSGQCGIYNYDDFAETEEFYDKACDTTDLKERWGIINGKGVVACSGFGDGFYKCYSYTDDKIHKVFKIELSFIE